ncbi:MAG TPA: TonB-dependent receptor [Candidatus Baltobacteraceae bacterium]|jgi:Tfp pilus assembly protein PilF|nr:TonB-dependent receptor [Candidatus Baltobacteraceae bacterium]
MTTEVYRRIAGALVLLAVLLTAPVVLSQTPLPGPQDTVLLSIAGTVEVAPAGTSSWSSGHVNQILHLGDQLRSGKNSRATLRLSDRTVFRIYELTTMTIKPAPKAGQNQVIEVKSGAAYFFNRDKPNQTQFQTPSSSGAIRGTEFNLAVAEDGKTRLTLLDGQVELGNAQGSVELESGQEALVEMGKAPTKSSRIDAINVIQWTLYYPAILDIDELELSGDVKQSLSSSLEAYRAGDVLQALAQYPETRVAASESERVYHATLLLAVGEVDGAAELLNQSTHESRPAALAEALKEMIAAVKGQPWNRTAPRTLATEWLAGSYQAQAHRDLGQALQMALSAAAKSPGFGFAQERVAEMEFSFGHTGPALSALKRSLELSPRNAQALAVKGFVLSGQNRINQARQCFDDAIALDGSLANAWLGRGLINIRQNNIKQGRQDLETAAALEPNRAFLRSYLGKAWSQDLPGQYSWDTHLAKRELGLAMRLDPNDPTAWLYSALINDQRNRINEAIDDLEHSEALNDNRAVFRSKFSLDQDAAVRAANLALIYEDAGLSDVAVREATKSVEGDYANYSAHLFLSDTYDALRDHKDANLRYETPWEDELLVANLLAPVGAGVLSQSVSQQEYSKLFASDGPQFFSQTEFFSRGAWLENASQFGTVEDMSYSLNAYYYSDPGWRPNNTIENSDFSAQVKYQIDAKDTVFLQVERTELDAGDVLEHYYYKTDYDPSLKETEVQDPNLLMGYHRDWGNGNHTLVLYRGLQDYFTANDANYNAPLLASDLPAGIFPSLYPAVTSLQSTTELNSVEAQHIFESDIQSAIVGTRYQAESIQTANTLAQTATFTPLPEVAHVNSDFERFSIYGYYQLKLFDSLHLTGGAAYDWERFPLNLDGPPLSSAEDQRGRLSPKVGLDWTLPEGTRLRADYTRSMSGLLNDGSTLIEPSEVAGFNQEFRSLIPESAGKGTPPATEFETWGLGADHKFPTRTYVDIEGQLLTSRGDQLIGAWSSGAVPVPLTVADLSQSQYFQEKDAFASISQLIGSDLSVGVSYTLTAADLSTHAATPPGTTPSTAFNTHEDSTLNEVSVFANFYAPCGFFSQFQANWWKQENIESMDEPGDSFAQFNLYAGYRFPRRHVEVMVGVVNIGNQDYNIDPLTYFLEQAHSRTFVASFKFNF